MHTTHTHTHTHTLHVWWLTQDNLAIATKSTVFIFVLSCTQGYLLVYEITSKISYDLVLSLRQKIALKNKDVSCMSYTAA